MPAQAEARAWWAEVEDVRDRIERRRAAERSAVDGCAPRTEKGPRRTVRITGQARPPAVATRLRLVEDQPALTASQGPARHRRRRPLDHIGPRPDRIAAWAVALGFLLVIIAAISAHG
jgi:hypothetical protein